jgi:hypothetical protein
MDFCSSLLELSASEQRKNLQILCFANQISFRDIEDSKEACGKVATKIEQVYEWHKCFRDGRSSPN